MAPVIRGNSLYSIFSNPDSNWATASSAARALGGFLLSINDQEEHQFIGSLTYRGSINERVYWTGLRSPNGDSTWEWESGESNTYRSWGDQELGVNRHNGENYVVIHSNDTLPRFITIHETDTYYQEDHYGIAEIPLTSSITFSTAPKEGAGVFTTSINLLWWHHFLREPCRGRNGLLEGHWD